jgi:hypothetical protein
MTGLFKKVPVYCCTALILLCTYLCHAQGQQQQPVPIQFASPHPAAKLMVRSEIDAKRMGVNVNSEDALPRSREFLRTDSTYYVGWMYEGAYKYNHAADYIGYKNASVPLEHALRLMERDYRKQLATRTDNLMVYFPAYKFDIDYTLLALYLMNCYSNMDEPGKVYLLMRRVLRWNFQRDFYMDAYNYLGWTVHRNRFYTSDKYPFLKNSIKDNEALANRMLDSGMRKIYRDRVTNAHIFPPGYDANDILGVYHYKSILYSYAINIDSAEYYFNKLRNTALFPHNNYATFRAICGDFRTAESEYKKSISSDAGDKHLQEWAYYSSIIDNYKAQPKTGIALMRDMIRSAGSTPGFGWYNIALARCMVYDGQIDEANRYADKAASFKELHIGTTLGQSQYDFSIQLLKLINKDAAFEQQIFENRNWWYNPRVLGSMTSLKVDKYLQQFLIINQFSQNPERDLVIYKLFSTESTVSWDEIWYLIKDFSTGFFLDKFKKQAQADDRKYVRKYFQLFVALLEMKQGNYTYAHAMLDGILRSPATDADYEKLFIARVYQAQAECARERKDIGAYNDWVYRMYVVYPQLLPYTGLKVNMNLHMTGAVDKVVADRLNACNINWVTDASIPTPDVYIAFVNNGNRKDIQYSVATKSGTVIVNKQTFAYQKPEEAGVNLAYRIFSVGGKEPDTAKDNMK